MPKPAVRPETSGPWLAVAAILAMTLWRVLWLAASRAELGVDEAQYWLWSRSLDWGYFSKPPVIAWIIRATTDLLGSDTPFAVRLSAPLLQGAAALLVMRFAKGLAGDRAGSIAGLIYLVMPAGVVGSMTISTDTPMLFCLALSLVLWVGLAQQPSPGRSLGLGLAIGLAVLSKYSMLFVLPGMVLAGLFLPRWRLCRRDTVLAVVAGLVTVAPNVAWNLRHGLATLRHTADSAQWSGLQLHPDRATSFLLSQFAVFGPVFFAIMVICSAQALLGRGPPDRRGPVLLTLPVLAVVTGQALLSHAYANWAVAAAVGGSLLAALVLRAAPRLLALVLVLHAALALVLPMLPALAIDLRLPNGQALFKRYTGREDSARFALDLAQSHGLTAIVAGERAMLADLFYYARPGDPAIYAAPQSGPPANHYAMFHALPPGLPGRVLLVIDDSAADRLLQAIPEIQELGRYQPASGWALRRTFVALAVPAGRLSAGTLEKAATADGG